MRSTEKQATTWDNELPADIKNTYDKLGIPGAEKQRLVAGVARAIQVRWSTLNPRGLISRSISFHSSALIIDQGRLRALRSRVTALIKTSSLRSAVVEIITSEGRPEVPLPPSERSNNGQPWIINRPETGAGAHHGWIDGIETKVTMEVPAVLADR